MLNDESHSRSDLPVGRRGAAAMTLAAKKYFILIPNVYGCLRLQILPDEKKNKNVASWRRCEKSL
jgi:hypothetical protein